MKNFEAMSDNEGMNKIRLELNSFESDPQTIKINSMKPKWIEKLSLLKGHRESIQIELEFYKSALKEEGDNVEVKELLFFWQRKWNNNYQSIFRYEGLLADPLLSTKRRKRAKPQDEDYTKKVSKEIELIITKLEDVPSSWKNDRKKFLMGVFSVGGHKWAERVHYVNNVLCFYRAHSVGNFCDFIITYEKVIR